MRNFGSSYLTPISHWKQELENCFWRILRISSLPGVSPWAVPWAESSAGILAALGRAVWAPRGVTNPQPRWRAGQGWLSWGQGHENSTCTDILSLAQNPFVAQAEGTPWNKLGFGDVGWIWAPGGKQHLQEDFPKKVIFLPASLWPSKKGQEGPHRFPSPGRGLPKLRQEGFLPTDQLTTN